MAEEVELTVPEVVQVDQESSATNQQHLGGNEAEIDDEAAKFEEQRLTEDENLVDGDVELPSDDREETLQSPAETPLVAHLTTHLAPRKPRLDRILEVVKKNSLPAPSTSAAYKNFPDPLIPLDSSIDGDLTEYVTLLSPEEYWKRVDSFASWKWFGKPLTVSPLECSRFGWENRSEDSLACVQCKKQLIFQCNDPSQLVEYTRQFVGLLQSTHHADCPFKSKGVPAQFYTLKSKPSSNLVHAFYERLYALKHQATVQDINNDVELQVDTDTINHFAQSNGVDVFDLSSLVGLESQLSEVTREALFCLALSGWWASPSSKSPSTRRASAATSHTTSPNSQQLKIRCLHCRRETSAFISQALPHSTTDNEEEPSSKRHKSMETFFMDPTSDHQVYCPWVTMVPNDSHVGWQVCLRVVVLSLEKSRAGPSQSAVDEVLTQDAAVEVDNPSNPAGTSSIMQRIPRTLERVKSLMNA